MSRLRNRMVKADFWTDPELLRWPLGKRMFYQGLWAIAEDSGCLEDDPFGWKLQLFPSPLDAEITLERLVGWRDELVAAGKLFPYEADGKCYLFIRTFHQHERPRNPQRPDLPLPTWLEHDVTTSVRGDGTVKRNAYRVTTNTLPLPNGDGSVTVLSPPPRLAPSRVPKGTKGKGTGNGGPVNKSTVRAAVDKTTCWRCGGVISPDDMAEDRCVFSTRRGLRHADCIPAGPAASNPAQTCAPATSEPANTSNRDDTKKGRAAP